MTGDKKADSRHKTCSRCKKILPLESFNIDRKTKSGRQSYCKKCRKEMYHENKSVNAKKEKEYRVNNPFELWAMHTRINHKNRGVEIDITVRELVDIAKLAADSGCYYCGTKMEMRTGKGKSGNFSPNSFTVDIIDSSKKIMNAENIKIVCHSCNAGKGSQTHEEFVIKSKNVADRWFNQIDK